MSVFSSAFFLLTDCQELDLLSGIAALLTYPLDIEMVELEEENEKAEDKQH